MSRERVGVMGDERLAAAVDAAGGQPIDERDAFETAAFVVAAGESALTELAHRKLDIPVLAVETPGSVDSVPIDRLESAVERVFDGDPSTVTHPIVEAAGSFDPLRAIFDVGLMAAEPARISEFSVYRNDDRVSRFRADGVVASTPAGSGGYNRSADGPVIEPGTGVAAVVPIAPFAISTGHWVLSIDSVRLSVERDETPVELLVDGRRAVTIETSDTVTLSTVDSIETYLLPECTGPV